MDEAKPFCISKREVWMAYKRVKENRGAAGVDDQTIAEFEKDLKNNLYRLWNRMSSGSYMPPPVRRVNIPKGDGGTRPLGIPTVSDRIAQMVVKRYLEPSLEPVFHEDSYTDIAPVGRRMMHWPRRGSDAGVTTGCSISTSKASSTTSIGSC
jgi:retron-type reverse transcriptase